MAHPERLEARTRSIARLCSVFSDQRMAALRTAEAALVSGAGLDQWAQAASLAARGIACAGLVEGSWRDVTVVVCCISCSSNRAAAAPLKYIRVTVG